MRLPRTVIADAHVAAAVDLERRVRVDVVGDLRRTGPQGDVSPIVIDLSSFDRDLDLFGDLAAPRATAAITTTATCNGGQIVAAQTTAR